MNEIAIGVEALTEHQVLAVARHGYRKSGSSGHVDRYTLRACEEAMS